MKELQPREPCACGSGKEYRKCCKKKNFKWARDSDGDVFRSVPIGKDLLRVLDEFKGEFKKVFGRAPRQTDPLTLAKYLLGPEDLRRETTDAIRKAKVDGELEYGYRKTGRLMTSRTASVLPDAEVAEWDSAIGEYSSLKGKTIEEHDFVEQTRSLINEIDCCIIALGHALEQGPRRRNRANERSASKLVSFEGYVLFCAAFSFRVLRSIALLIDKDRTAEALALSRTLFESYLHISFIKANPDKLDDLVDASIGLARGTHEYKKTKQGGNNRRVVVELATGLEFEGHISGYRMAQASGLVEDTDLYDYHYDALSGLVHPDFGEIHRLIDEEGGLDLMRHEEPFEAAMVAIVFACMILDEVRKLQIMRKAVATDIQRVVLRIRNKILVYFKQYLDPEEESRAVTVIANRVALLGK